MWLSKCICTLERKDAHHSNPSYAGRALRDGREMVEPLPILPVRLLRVRDRLDVLLQRPEELLELRLLGLLARARDEQQLAEVLELLLDQADLQTPARAWMEEAIAAGPNE